MIINLPCFIVYFIHHVSYSSMFALYCNFWIYCQADKVILTPIGWMLNLGIDDLCPDIQPQACDDLPHSLFVCC